MKPVRWGILSTANIFAKAFAIPMQESPFAEPAAIASRSLDRARAMADRFGIPRAYGSYDELLADPAIDAVYIPLPNHMHHEWIKRAAEAKKHILCEKPLTLTAGETADAIECAEKHGVILMEAFMYRFHPQWRHVRDLVRTGNIGRVTAVQSFFSYNNTDPANIRNILDAGGGGLYDIGCYTISSGRFVFGREPKRVLSLLNRDPKLGTDTLGSAILDYDGAHCGFTISTASWPHQSVTVVGTDGKIHVEVPFNIHGDVPVRVTITTGVGVRVMESGPADQYRLQLDAFCEAVQSGGTAPTPPADALANMRVIDALFRSEQSGGWELVEG